jgi:hypothetical protein
MPDEKRYNGWTNYETWCVSLWLGNDEGLYETVGKMASDVCYEITDAAYEWQTLSDARVAELAEQIASFVDEVAEQTCPGCREGASFVSDLLGAALSEVNWREIAENRLGEWQEAHG